METVGDRLGESEIGDFDGGVVVLVHEENVLGLDIAMHNVPMVQIVDHFQHVLHERPRLHLVVSPQFDDSVEEIAARHELHDNIQVFLLRQTRVRCPPFPG